MPAAASPFQSPWVSMLPLALLVVFPETTKYLAPAALSADAEFTKAPMRGARNWVMVWPGGGLLLKKVKSLPPMLIM